MKIKKRLFALIISSFSLISLTNCDDNNFPFKNEDSTPYFEKGYYEYDYNEIIEDKSTFKEHLNHQIKVKFNGFNKQNSIFSMYKLNYDEIYNYENDMNKSYYKNIQYHSISPYTLINRLYNFHYDENTNTLDLKDVSSTYSQDIKKMEIDFKYLNFFNYFHGEVINENNKKYINSYLNEFNYYNYNIALIKYSTNNYNHNNFSSFIFKISQEDEQYLKTVNIKFSFISNKYDNIFDLDYSDCTLSEYLSDIYYLTI